jgi:succinate dehydrogenase / fumarate reductase, iron-sulfur subunit
MEFSIYRFNPDTDSAPHMQSFTLAEDQVEPGMMLLDALILLKEQDDSLGFRRSCQHGVCGSDGMNINGTNGLACITPLAGLKTPVVLRPFPGMPVIRDLIVDMDNFYRQYREAEPWLINDSPEPEVERRQSPEDREKLDGLYECILCGCCSASCPSYWWNPERFLGPAALLQAARFIHDSRDQATERRLQRLDDAYRLYRCHGIMNCTQVCPKGLNPSKAIGDIRRAMIKRSL